MGRAPGLSPTWSENTDHPGHTPNRLEDTSRGCTKMHLKEVLSARIRSPEDFEFADRWEWWIVQGPEPAGLLEVQK